MSRTVRIRGQVWKIVWRRRLMLGRDPVDGLCDANRRTIYLRHGMSPDRLLEVIHHEHGHATNWDHDETCVEQDAKSFRVLLGKCGLEVNRSDRRGKHQRQ